MPRIKVDIMGVTESTAESFSIIEVKADHKINIVRFMNLNHKFNWELVATPKEEQNCMFNQVKQIQFPAGKLEHSKEDIEKFKQWFEIPGIVEFVKQNLRFLINKEKRTVFTQIKDKKVSIKCDEEDKFDWKIGLGLGISHLIEDEKYKEHREFFRNKKTRKLDVKKYSNWVLKEFYGNNMFELEQLELRVKKAKDKEFIDL